MRGFIKTAAWLLLPLLTSAVTNPDEALQGVVQEDVGTDHIIEHRMYIRPSSLPLD